MTDLLVVGEMSEISEARIRDLRRQGYGVTWVRTGEKALGAFANADLVLLDLDIADVDGLEVCQKIRAISTVPVISLTHGGNELDRVLALQAGADDCVPDTCGSRELGARIEAVMRRVSPQLAATSEHISLGSLSLDSRAQEAYLGGRLIKLTTKEFDLLYLLASHPTTVISRKELMAKVWGYEDAWRSRTIDTHISSLRAKMGSRDAIITVRGVGYRMGRR